MRAMLAVVVAVLVGCSAESPPPGSPDAEPPRPDAGDWQYVQDGTYALEWNGSVPFAACDALELSNGGLHLAFAGADDACVELDGEFRGDVCRCYPGGEGLREWCLCPNLGRLHAGFVERDGTPVAELDAFFVP